MAPSLAPAVVSQARVDLAICLEPAWKGAWPIGPPVKPSELLCFFLGPSFGAELAARQIFMGTVYVYSMKPGAPRRASRVSKGRAPENCFGFSFGHRLLEAERQLIIQK